VANTRGYGAAVVLYDRWRESREAIAAGIAAERGASLVPPYDDARVVAGQGTAGLELVEQAAALDARLDALVVPASGGGLVAGCALALAADSPATKVYSAEPDGLDDLRRSLIAGERLANDPAARSICDALLAPMPGEITFAVNRRLLAGGLAVSDDEVLYAMAIAFAEFKLVVEPGGAAALATVMSGKLDAEGKTVAVVASGGNVDPETFIKAIAAG
jgi:threonine dehydratase